MLWKRAYVAMILEGRKTSTRRRAKPMVKVGGSYRIRVGFYEYIDRKILVESIGKQRLGEMTENDAMKEGAKGLDDFRNEWRLIYGDWDPDEKVWVVDFRLLPT